MAQDGEAARFERVAAEMGVVLDAGTTERLLLYRDELARWNRVHNLTAVRDPEEMVVRHLLDSLSVLPHVAGRSVIDVGTGAGLPGLVLALADPDRQYVLLDSATKRTRFLTHVVGRLGLATVTVVTSRVEGYRPAAPFDTVICRAFAPLPRLLELAAHLCAPAGRVLAMKGGEPADELAELPPGWKKHRVSRLKVPGLDAQRCVVDLRPAAESADHG